LSYLLKKAKLRRTILKGINTKSLYGGIFEWSNRGYPLINNWQEPTTKVHAFDKDWGRWLEKAKKVY